MRKVASVKAKRKVGEEKHSSPLIFIIVCFFCADLCFDSDRLKRFTARSLLPLSPVSLSGFKGLFRKLPCIFQIRIE